MNRPNILLITTDTQRVDTIAAMGNPHAISPHLDRLAREGICFDEAYTSSPVCGPARTSLLTGLHTPVHGVIENGYARNGHFTPFTDLLAEAGYTNIMVGKTHFGPTPSSFHEQIIVKGKKPETGEDPYAARLRAAGYEKVSQHPNPIPEELFEPAFVVDATIDAVRRTVDRGAGPFFAWCSILCPHGPLDPPGRWAEAYQGMPLPRLHYRPGEVRHHPRHLKVLLGLADDLPRKPAFDEIEEPRFEYIDHVRRLYYGLTAYCDDQIGRLIRYLDDSGLRNDTLVIFTSDHGTELFNHGFDDKHNYYDSSWRVPLIMSMPGVLPQGERRGFAIWNDLTATILAAAGVDAPFVQGFDLLREGGRSQGAVSPSPRRSAVATLYKSCALATKRWKLEYYFEERRGRLFDRVGDPMELGDLWDDPGVRALRDELLKALLTWRADLADVENDRRNNNGGGPVAQRVAALREKTRGTDAERRLDDTLAEIEERHGAS